MTHNLPDAALKFLRTGKQLEYDQSQCEAGRVGLHSLKQLAVGEVWVGTHMQGDPHSGQRGYYAIPAVSLSGECEAYSPEYILLWLPEEQLFGTWDCDHWVLTVFPKVTWQDIVSDPLRYLNAQWSSDSGGGVEFQPWPRYKFKKGRPF